MENLPLIEKLTIVLNDPVVGLDELQFEIKKQELLDLNKKDAYKGMKMHHKPTSMEVGVCFEQLRLEKNYFDKKSYLVDK